MGVDVCHDMALTPKLLHSFDLGPHICQSLLVGNGDSFEHGSVVAIDRLREPYKVDMCEAPSDRYRTITTRWPPTWTFVPGTKVPTGAAGAVAMLGATNAGCRGGTANVGLDIEAMRVSAEQRRVAKVTGASFEVVQNSNVRRSRMRIRKTIA